MNPARWDIFVSVLLSRRAVIAPPMNPIEAKYQQLSLKREDDRSLLCDYELKTKKDEELERKRAKLIEEGKDLSELEGELELTNAMREDEWAKREAMLKQRLEWTPTDSAHTSRASRLLDRRLALLVKQRFGWKGYTSPWILPQMKNENGESLRETAERCVSSLLPGISNISFYNAPFAVYSHRYSKGLQSRLQTDAAGAKLFFYSTDVATRTDEVDVNKKEIAELSWLTREEIMSTVPGKEYRSNIVRAMIE